MIYLKRDNKRQQKRRFITMTAVIVVFCTTMLLNFLKPNFFSPVTHAIFRPVFEARGGFWGGINNVIDFFKSKSSLIDENSVLKNKLELFEAAIQERDYYKNANAELLKMSDNFKNSKKIIFARILSKPSFSPYDTVVIEAGEEQGIKKGARVLADEDTLLGTVSEVYFNTSIVTLYSTAGNEIPVLIGKNSIQALALGKGGGNFEIKLPRNTGVSVGDSVSVSTTTPSFIGIVEFIKTSETDSFERAVFKNSADINNISFVAIQKI